MSQQINDNFQLLAGLPIDDRIKKPTIEERDGISSTRRFQGLQCFVEQTQTLYMLIGGIANTDWKGIAGSDTSNDIETIIEGFYVLLAGKETPLDWEVGDKFRGWIGSRYVVGKILALPVSLPSDIDDPLKVELAIDSYNIPIDGNVLHKTGDETKYDILTIENTLNLAPIIVNSTDGYITKNSQPFIHNFYAGVNPLQGGSGNNLNVGYNSGNFNADNFNYASTMLGFESGLSNKNGYSNVGIGYRNLHLNQNGFGNSALGTYVLGNLTSGTQNTAIGWHSMLYSTTASDNTAIGVEALWNNLIGLRNTAIGMRAGTTNTGNDNVFIGYNAGSAYTGSDMLYIANTNRSLITGNFSGNGFVSLNGAGEFMVAPTRKITFQNATGVEASLGWFSNLNTETNAYLDAFDYRIRTGGTVRLQISNAGALTLSTAPTTSAGTYDILTRNTSTGVVEKIPSSSLATSGNYTPTLSAATNIVSSAAALSRYTKVGNTITARISVSYTSANAANTLSGITITLPVNRNNSSVLSLGAASGYDVSNNFIAGNTQSNATNTFRIEFKPVSTSAGVVTAVIMYDTTD